MACSLKQSRFFIKNESDSAYVNKIDNIWPNEKVNKDRCWLFDKADCGTGADTH